MVTHLLEQNVTCEHRTQGKAFDDPLVKGAEKVGNGVVEKYIQRTDADEEMMDEENILDVNDLQYELHHVN